MSKQSYTIPRLSWSSLPPITVEIECAATMPEGVKLGLAVRVAVGRKANLSGADLSGADLSEEQLRAFKADLWLTLTEIGGPLEAQHTLAKLKAGKVNGSTYGVANECACLVGTIAKAKGVSYETLSHNGDRPAERWFMMIGEGDKPGDDTGGGYAAAKAVEWIEQWCAASGHPAEPDLTAKPPATPPAPEGS